MKKSVFLISLFGVCSFSFGNINVKSLDIYKNRTFVNQELNSFDNSVDLISNISLDEIRFVYDKNCTVSNTKVIRNNTSAQDISSKIISLKEKIAYSENEVKSIKNVLSSLENIRFEKEAVSLENIKQVSSYTKEELRTNYNNLYNLNLQLHKYKIELNRLKQTQKSQKFSTLKYTATCKNNSSVVINYGISNIHKNSFYEIKANSKEKNIDIKNMSFITQSSGYDFKNIDINLFTYNYTNQIKPTKFYPEYLDVYTNPPVAYMQSDAVMMEKSISKKARVLNKPAFSYNETATKSFFKASNITLISGDKTPVVFASENYKTSNGIEIDGFANAKAFYKVEFLSDKLFSTLNTRLYLDEVFIARSYTNEIKKDKKTSMYFGEDRFIDVKKELIKDMKEEPFFTINKIKTQKEWKYTIVNNHSEEKSINFIERIPVSKHEDIKVKLISKIKYTKKENNGKISYDFVLKPKEKRSFVFGYEVEKPYKK